VVPKNNLKKNAQITVVQPRHVKRCRSILFDSNNAQTEALTRKKSKSCRKEKLDRCELNQNQIELGQFEPKPKYELELA
jgi:hypothetical protein